MYSFVFIDPVYVQDIKPQEDEADICEATPDEDEMTVCVMCCMCV